MQTAKIIIYNKTENRDLTGEEFKYYFGVDNDGEIYPSQLVDFEYEIKPLTINDPL